MGIFLKKKKRRVYKDNLKKIQYIRYLNCFAVGVFGSYKLIQKISRQIVTFCNSNLKLFITHHSPINLNSSSIFEFLNFKITFSKFKKTITKYQNKKNNSARTKIKRTFNTSSFLEENASRSNFKQLKNRNIQKSISLMIPFKELIENLKKKMSFQIQIGLKLIRHYCIILIFLLFNGLIIK